MQSTNTFVLVHCTVLDGAAQCKLFPLNWYSAKLESRSQYLIASAVENTIKLFLERSRTQLARSALPLALVISDGGSICCVTLALWFVCLSTN